MSVETLDSSHHAYRRIAPLRGLRRAMVGFLLALYVLAGYVIWREAVRDARVQLQHLSAALAQGARATLKQHELLLRGLGTELVLLGALSEAERGRGLIEP